MSSRRGRLAALLVLVSLSCVSGAERIDLLLIGHVVSSYNPLITFLDPDPSVRYVMVPTTGSYAVPLGDAEARRYVNQYFPRTYETLRQYDFIMYSIPYIVPLTLRQISWLRQVVAEGECSALTDQGGLRMKGINDLADAEYWVGSGMSDIFANDAEKVLQTGKVSYSNAPYRLQVSRSASHQVLAPLIPLGLEQIPALGLFHVVPKEGSVVVADALGAFVDIPGSPSRSPWLMHYDYMKGSTWTLCDNFVNPFWCGMYYGQIKGDLQTDVLMNIIWYSVGWELPQDAALVHQMRIRFRDYITRRSLQISVMEFVDALGANLVRAENTLNEADRVRAWAEELYLDQDYDATAVQLSVAFDLLNEASEIALREKRAVMMWIYLVEWTSVTGTLMVCGVLVYGLMVRRRYYRGVQTTRLS